MSKEMLIEKLRGYKSTPRHCEELCYEAANVIESMIQKLIAAQEASEFDHSEYRRLREELRQQLADSQKRDVLLRDALWKITHPIDTMQAKLKNGEQLNGPMAVRLASDPSYLKEIAREALASTADLDGLIVCHMEPVGADFEGGLYRAWEPK